MPRKRLRGRGGTAQERHLKLSTVIVQTIIIQFGQYLNQGYATIKFNLHIITRKVNIDL